jgi:signal transduction histidine kinase
MIERLTDRPIPCHGLGGVERLEQALGCPDPAPRRHREPSGARARHPTAAVQTEHIQLQCQYGENLPPLRAVRVQIQQVIMNLLRNGMVQ